MGLIGTGIGVQIGGGSGFSPKSLGSALVLWLRSDLGVTITMGAVVATGTAPPTVTITGTPVQSPPGSVPSIEIDCTLGGALGVWQYTWKNNGVVQATNVVSSAGPTVLGATGLSVSVAAGAATNDNVWTCKPQVSAWADQSGNGNHFTNATQSTQPDYVRSWTANLPSIHGNPTRTAFMLCVNAGTTIFTGASAEHFYAGQAPSDPTASTDGAVGSNWGSQAAISRYSPFSDGHIYDTFGSTAQQNVATHPAGILASPYIYDSYSASADWQQFLNGTRNFTNGVNTVGFNAAGPYLFFAGGAVYGNQQYGEWLGINRKLSNTERTAMTRYFGTRYGVTVP